MTESYGDLPRGFKDRLDLSRHATPRLLRKTPVHNWFVFPHSYSQVLVDSLFEEWELDEGARIYDPFVGAGTTVLAAKYRSLAAIGTDISPLSVFVTNAKVALYRPEKLSDVARKIQRAAERLPLPRLARRPPFLAKALELGTHQRLERIRRAIIQEADGLSTKFFLLALLRVLPHYSRALPDGGWFRWRRVRSTAATVSIRFARTVKAMLLDLQSVDCKYKRSEWHAYRHDARLPLKGFGEFDALITSPPYPNRHDYTRIFTIELLFLFLREEQLKRLRHRNLRSHVEARPIRVQRLGWELPRKLELVLDKLSDIHDQRVPRMIRGYFEDMYLTLKTSRKLVKRKGHLAFVVGNVQHAGAYVPVDELVAELGEQAGLRWKQTWLIRLRGNSAQQMGRFGRKPSRESVVIFERP